MLKTKFKYFSMTVLVLILSSFFIKTSIACRMYGAISDNFPDGLLYDHLIGDPPAYTNFPTSLKKLAESGHVDGWGIAYYPGYGDTAIIERGAEKAYTDDGYDAVVGNINTSEPKITIAHIRFCTSGCCDHGGESIDNPHPFYRDKNGKTWTFQHNGGVNKTRLYSLIGDDYLYANAPYNSDIPDCYTLDPYDPLVIDSELYFLHILKNIEEHDWNVVNGIVEAVMELINDGETGGMIFFLSDGYTIWAFLRGSIPSYHTLFYEYNSSAGYSAVASQYPSSSQGDWQSINNNELAVLTANEAPLIIDVTTYDGIPDSQDNCLTIPNGPLLGTCTSGTVGDACKGDDDCGMGGFCSMDQEDTYPPGGNGIGDACDCEGNFDCDLDVDAEDVTAFLDDFGRNAYSNPCEAGNQCKGDFSCDGDVDAVDVTKFLEDFGRNAYSNSCPDCVEGDWCVY